MDDKPIIDLAGKRLAVSSPLVRPPVVKDPHVRWGMAKWRESEDRSDQQVLSFTRTRDLILSGALNGDPAGHLTDIKKVGLVFDRAYSARAADWFLQATKVGNPSHLMAKMVCDGLLDLQEAISAGDTAKVTETLNFLYDEAVVDMLDHFLARAGGEVQQPEVGWAYLGWIAKRPVLVYPGVSGGSMTEILAGLADRDPSHDKTYGVVAAWLVQDINSATDTLHDILGDKIITKQSKAGACQVALGETRNKIEAALIASGNLLLSPWHAPEALRRLGLEPKQMSGTGRYPPLQAIEHSFPTIPPRRRALPLSLARP
jgi:hypothetical protein